MQVNAVRKWLTFATRIAVLAFLLNLTLMKGTSMFTHRQDNGNKALEQAVNKLFSANHDVRLKGRQEILQIGSAAADAMVDLLNDLIRDRRPRFVLERAEEGRNALIKYVHSTNSDKQSENEREQLEIISKLVINERLSSDAISLLGEMKAAQGIPILIRIMQRRSTDGSEPIGSELGALTRIGPPAIPFLIDSIEHSRRVAIEASQHPPINFGWIASLDLEDYWEDEEDEVGNHQEDQTILDPETEFEIEMRVYKIKQKALLILGEIGDRSTLPFLEALAKNESDQMVPNIEAAIRRIIGKPSTGKGPVPLKRIPHEP